MRSRHPTKKARLPAFSLLTVACVLATGCADDAGPADGSAAHTQPASSDETGAAEPVVLHLRIDGMTCKNCVKLITARTTELSDVIDCSIELETAAATITVGSEETRGSVIETIEELGYAVVEDSTPPPHEPAGESS